MITLPACMYCMHARQTAGGAQLRPVDTKWCSGGGACGTVPILTARNPNHACSLGCFASVAASDVRLDFRTVDLWSRKALRRASGELNDRAVQLHPSSVLSAQVAKLGALALHERSKRSALFLVFFRRIKTSQVFLSDASVVGPMPLMLLAGSSMQQQELTRHDDDDDDGEPDGGDTTAPSSPSPVQEVLLEIDHLRFVTSAEQAKLLLGLRTRIALLIDAALSNATLDPSTANRSGIDIDVDAASEVIAAVSSLVQSIDCESKTAT
jgi:hypothetical protein